MNPTIQSLREASDLIHGAGYLGISVDVTLGADELEIYYLKTARLEAELASVKAEAASTIERLTAERDTSEANLARLQDRWDARPTHESLENEVARLTAERDALTAALTKIQQWDCLNPPRADLLGDLPWLRRLVDAALAALSPKSQA